VIRKILPAIFLSGVLMFFLSVDNSLLSAQEKEKPKPLDLDETKWELTITYVSAKSKKKSYTDILVFENKKVLSEDFEKSGYSPTNYSLTVKDDGRTSFGTMQNKGKETAFWKGAINKDRTMTGSLHVQRSKGKATSYYFKGKLISGSIKTKAEKEAERKAQEERAAQAAAAQAQAEAEAQAPAQTQALNP